MFKVQYRTVVNDAIVSEWKDWIEIGTFLSTDDAMNELIRQFKFDFVDVSYDKIGIYQSVLPLVTLQFRFRTASQKINRTDKYAVEESPWKLGLNEA